jgi:chromodomain-helicase-DNA-binding protein 4
MMGADPCQVCGVAHFGFSDKCLHYLSVVQIRVLLDSLRQSNEPKAKVDAARMVLRRELARKLQPSQQIPRTGLPS